MVLDSAFRVYWNDKFVDFMYSNWFIKELYNKSKCNYDQDISVEKWKLIYEAEDKKNLGKIEITISKELVEYEYEELIIASFTLYNLYLEWLITEED